MSECWNSIKVKDLGTVITGKTPPTKDKHNFGKGYPFIKPPDLSEDTRTIKETETEITEDGLSILPEKLIPPKSTCVVCIGSIGKKIGLTSLPSVTNQQINSIVVYQSSYDPHFVYYLLRAELPQVKQLNAGSASGRENVNKSTFENIEVRAPSIALQRKIASVLSPYDDLIENNTRRIEILEEMAKLIYEEWFVKLKFPGHENVKMVHSELGEIPDGWKTRKIKDITEITKGMSYKSENLVEEGGCAFVNLKCINRGGGFRYEGLKRFEGKFKDRNIVNQNDIVLAVTDMTQNREIIARPARVPKMDEKTILISMDLVKIAAKDSDIQIWLFGLLKYSQFGEILKDFANGVNVLHLSTENILDYAFTLPDAKLIFKYTEVVSNFYKISDNLELKNQNLRKTRDLLLPKLISGEIDVSDLNIRIRNENQES